MGQRDSASRGVVAARGGRAERVGAACERTLCLRAALGLAPDAAGAARGWLQVGMSSTIDPATWQHPPPTFVMTVDVSGAMQWDYPGDEYASPGRLALYGGRPASRV